MATIDQQQQTSVDVVARRQRQLYIADVLWQIIHAMKTVLWKKTTLCRSTSDKLHT